jgi:DNA-binding winged helix-turn-helix (wHTH) protein/tetratricopeptide (TPR) repeat protein
MSDPSAFEFGPFRLSTEKSVLWRGGELVPLTPKAFDLLRVLVEHQGDVVTKSELLSRVWTDTVVEEGNLSVTVTALRKALDPQPNGRSYIQTVPRRGYRFDGAIRSDGGAPRLSLAVLPFACLGPEDGPQIGLGMADAIIGRLTAQEALLVRPTVAVAPYAGTAVEPRRLAADLGVEAVVTGTIQRDGDRVRVSVQLVPRPIALRPWAQSFDADWTDLFAVQDEIAERVAEALWPRLAAGRATTPVRAGRPRPSPAAHEAYLRGRFFWARFDPESLGRAFGYFGEAARLDPAYAAPRGGLADAHLLLGLAGLAAPRDAWDLAAACADQALERDPDLAEGHVARGYARLFRDWDWPGAREALDRAAARLPGAASVHIWRGLFLALAGESAAAEAAIARGREIDPLSGVAAAFQCFLHELAGEHDAARDLARRAVELRPDNFLGHRCLGMASLRLGEADEGLRALERAAELMHQGPGMQCLLAWGLARVGRSEAARAKLAALDALGSTTFVSPCLRGAVLAALGDTAAALDRIEEAAAARDGQAVFVGVDPLYAPLAGEPRFAALASRIGARS